MKSFTAAGLMRALVALPGLAFACGGAAAQAVDCNRLALQIASMGQSAAPDRAQDATRKAQTDLARAVAYARSIGCEKPQFLFFGDRPAQCDGLNAQIQRMQANVAQLQRAAYGDPGLRQQLQNKYDTWCRDGLRREPNFLERLFGTGPDRVYPPEPGPPGEETDAGPMGGPVAVCVRTCDGGFFPVSYSARRSDLGPLQDLCTALCPNAEVKVYTRSMSRDMHSAISASGEAYSDMPNAFRYEKVADKTCTCKPPDKSWVEALAEAEQMLGERRKGDMIVTAEQAEQMSRPKQPGAAPATTKKTKFDAAAAQKLLDERKAADAQSEAERALAAQAPTAGTQSSGINVGERASAVSRGETRDAIGPDGRRRQIRVLGQ